MEARDAALKFMTEHATEAEPTQNIRVEGKTTGYMQQLEQWQEKRDEEASRPDPDVDKLKKLDQQLATWKRALGVEEDADTSGVTRNDGSARQQHTQENPEKTDGELEEIRGGLSTYSTYLTEGQQELEQLKAAYDADPSQAAADAYNQRREQLMQDVEAFAGFVDRYNMYNTPESIAQRQKTALENYDKAMEQYRKLSGVEAAQEAGVNIRVTADSPYSTSAEAMAAAKRYKQEADALANQYYYAENEAQKTALQQDTEMSGQYAKATEIQSDIDKVTAVMADAANHTGGGKIVGYKVYLAEKYGLTQEAIDAYATYGSTYAPEGEGYTNLYQLLEDLQTQKEQTKQLLSQSGYEYDRMHGYEQTLADAQAYEEKRKEWEQYAEEHPVLASIDSVLAAPFQGADYAVTAAEGIGHSDTSDLENYVPLNIYNMDATNYVSTVRETVSKTIEENTDWEIFGQNVASFLYNTGMSAADSAVQVGAMGSGAIWLMGSAAASNQARDIIQRGGTNDQAFWGGLAAGAAEVAFEKFSVDNLLTSKTVTGWKSWIKETMKQAGTEASEEALTEIANILSDAAIMGESSSFSQAMKEYRRGGMTEKQARQQAFLDCIGQVAWSGAGGLLSGAAAGGVVNGGRAVTNTGTQATAQLMPDALVQEDTLAGDGGRYDVRKNMGNGWQAAHEQDSAAMEFFALDSRDRLQEVVKRTTIKLESGFSCFPDGDVLTEHVKLVAPQENCFDVAMHGNPTAVGFGTEASNMSPRTLASVIRHSEGYHGQDVRLLSCSTGQSIDGDYCFAEELSNALGVKVFAPNDMLYLTKEGTMWIGKNGEGEFVTYTPNQRRRFK